MKNKYSILFVCTGNICRSPMAEGILKKILKDRGIDNSFVIDSAATHDYHTGHAPHELSQHTARLYDIDISQQKSRKITLHDMQKFSLIVYMDDYNYENIINLFGEEFSHKLRSLVSYCPDSGYKDVPDPYRLGKDGFITVYTLLEAACEKIADYIESKAKT